MARRSTYIITGGGTGGHVYPGLAIAGALQSMETDCRINFVGTKNGIESQLVPGAGYNISFVTASGVRGLGFTAQVMFAVNLFIGIIQSFTLLLKLKPKAVIGTGGFVSVPVLLTAFLLGYPVFIQEQNSIPGSTNRLLGKYAKRIYLGFDSARKYFPIGRTVVTGNPVRAEFGKTSSRVSDRSVNLLVFGGSRGARTINRAVAEAANDFLKLSHLNLHLQTGDMDAHAEITSAYSEFPVDRITIDSYINDMPSALQWADIVVCRAGAMTLAELAVAGKPSILVPYPYATDDHQFYNATDFANAGAAVVIKDDNFNGVSMFTTVASLTDDKLRLAEMGKSCSALGRIDAAEVIAENILGFINNINGESNVS